MLSLPRRRVISGAAATAAAAGIGLGLWRQRDSGSDVFQELWDMRFERPAGGELSMSDLRGRAMVLNFWASWCAPCVREMPELDRFHRQYSAQGWSVVGLAIDNAEPVREFLQRTPVTFPIGLATAQGASLMRRLGNAQGGLPFTVVLDSMGKRVRTHLVATDYATLVKWASDI